VLVYAIGVVIGFVNITPHTRTAQIRRIPNWLRLLSCIVCFVDSNRFLRPLLRTSID